MTETPCHARTSSNLNTPSVPLFSGAVVRQKHPPDWSIVVVLSLLMVASCWGTVAGWGHARVERDVLEADIGPARREITAWSSTGNGCRIARATPTERGGWRVWLDGEAIGSYAAVEGLQFSMDGSAFALVAREKAGGRYVINGVEQPVFASLGILTFSGNGRHHTYVAEQDGSLVVVADGIIHRCSTGYKFLGDFAVLIPDGRRLAWIEEETKGPKISPDGHRRVRWVIDGTPEPLFAGCGVTLFVSDTGHSVAYAANDGDKWFVRVNGISHPKFDAIGVDLVFSPDGKRIAYFAYTAEDRQLVIDGEGQKSIEGNLDHMLTFSPDGKRILYGVLKRDGTCHIVVDDVSGPVYDCIGSRSLDVPTDVKVELPLGALFSPDSKRVAYVAERDGQCLIVTDGVEGKTRFGSLISGFGADSHGRLHRRVRRNALMFSPDSQRVALAACSRFGTKQYAVVDDRKHTEYRGISSLSFSPDSKHIAYCAMIGIHRGWVVVVDGVEREQYDSLVTPPVYRDDGVLEFIAIKDRGLLRVQVRHND